MNKTISYEFEVYVTNIVIFSLISFISYLILSIVYDTLKKFKIDKKENNDKFVNLYTLQRENLEKDNIIHKLRREVRNKEYYIVNLKNIINNIKNVNKNKSNIIENLLMELKIKNDAIMKIYEMR